MIERRNILSLIGADSNKYHTCIITSYSFDFMFFEQRILPKLRRAGMVNINVYVDAAMFEKQMAQLDGNFVNKQTYSITPVKINGAFHPKILMCLGKTNGMLAIGSGNLTHSGLSGNDEVWGAFHTYKAEGKAAPLFKDVYKYLLKLKAFSFGFNLKKWSWIQPNSRWLDEIENTESGVKTTNAEDIYLLGSFQDNSIYARLKSKLPKTPVKRISIVSPYYNKDGRLLRQLLEDFQPESMHVIIDGRFGTIPHKLVVDKRIQFHQWHELKKEDSKISPRLHAKMIQFEFAEETYFFTGSSNATDEAFGLNDKPTRNAEMNLLIGSKKNTNYLEEMEIVIPKKGLDNIANIKPSPIEFESSSQPLKKCHIQQVDKDLEFISIYIDRASELPETFNICIDCPDSVTSSIYRYKGDFGKKINLKISEDDAQKGFRLFITDVDGLRISNYQRLQELSSIERTNPDNKAKKLLDLISKEELNDDDLITLLEFANFDKAVSTSDSSRSYTSVNPKVDLNEKEYETQTEEEFNKNQAELEEYHKTASNNLGLLENFLNDMVFAVPQKENLSDNKELTALEAGDEGIEEDEDRFSPEPIVLSFHEGRKIQRKLHNTLNNISSALSWKHKEIATNLIKYQDVSTEISIEDVKSLLVGMHLLKMKDNEYYVEERIKLVVKYTDIKDLELFEKRNKRLRLERMERQEDDYNRVAYSADAILLDDMDKNLIHVDGVELTYNDQTPSMEIPHQYFKDGPIISRQKQVNTTTKGFLLNVVAPSLLSLQNGQIKLSETETAKYYSFKYRLLLRVLVFCNMVTWKRSESILLKLVVLNSLYVLNEDKPIEAIEADMNSLMSRLNIRIDSQITNENIKQYLTDYSSWIKIYSDDKKELVEDLSRKSVGNIIFKSQIGFAVVQTLGSNALNLMSPLGNFNTQTKTHEFRNFKWGKKAIVFK